MDKQWAISTISKTAQQAFDKARAMMLNEQYSTEHKMNEVKNTIKTALEDCQLVYGVAHEALAEKIAHYETTLAYNSSVPSADQVAQLNYTRDALASRWQSMTPKELADDWQRALDSGDLITARDDRDWETEEL